MEIARILLQLRTEKGIYQKELAAALNVSIGTISNYENGTHSPDLVTLCRLADFYDVTTDFLLGRSDCRHLPQALSQKLTKDYTVADLVNTTLEFRKNEIRAVVDYINLLKFRKDHSKDENPQST